VATELDKLEEEFLARHALVLELRTFEDAIGKRSTALEKAREGVDLIEREISNLKAKHDEVRAKIECIDSNVMADILAFRMEHVPAKVLVGKQAIKSARSGSKA
jgi:phage shock protein A